MVRRTEATSDSGTVTEDQSGQVDDSGVITQDGNPGAKAKEITHNNPLTAKKGDVIATPDKDKDLFTPLGGGRWRHRDSGAIYEKSNSTHTGKTGEWKVGLKKGKEPSRSNKITVDIDGKVLKIDREIEEMRLTEIFNDVKKQWPNEIIIGDCILSNNKERLSCEWLSKLWWKIDTDSIVHGEWGRLMCWGIFCGIQQHIKSLQSPYPMKMHIDELDIECAVDKINESINCIESVYYKERGEHINDLQTLIDER